MSAWREFRHVVRWDLVHGRWWALGCAGLVILGAVAAWRDAPGLNGFGPSAIVPAVWSLLAGLGTATLIQADSPIAADRFFRGKPLRPGLLPVAKLVAAVALFVLPAMLVMLAFYLSLDVPRDAIARSELSILSTTAALLALLAAVAMVTTHPSGTIALLIGSFVASGLIGDALREARVPTVPIGPVLIASAVVLVWSLYRRPVRRRAAQLSAVLLLALSALPQERLVASRTTMTSSTPFAPGGDSVQLTIDSTSVVGRSVRVAFHIDSRSAYDGHVLQTLSASAQRAGRPVPLLAVDLVPPNTPTSIDKVALVRFDAAGGASFGNIGTLDMSARNASPPNIHRIPAVAVFATPDTGANLRVDQLSAWGFAYRWLDSTTVPVRFGEVWADRGERVRLDTMRLGGRLRWRFRQSRPFTAAPFDSSLPAGPLRGSAPAWQDGLYLAVRLSPSAPLRPTLQVYEGTGANMFAVPGAIQERREGDLTNGDVIDPTQAQLFIARRTFVARVRLSTSNTSNAGLPRVP